MKKKLTSNINRRKFLFGSLASIFASLLPLHKLFPAQKYIDKIDEQNIANKTEVISGLRTNQKIEIISGLEEGDIIVAEGLKKVRPQGKIKPINK